MNFDIEADTVRVVGGDGEQIGILPLQEAIARAADEGLDLVLMSANANPPVCRIMDYGKFKYEASKKANLARKRQHNVQIKEVKVRASTDQHDLEVKLRQARRFLQNGNKVKLSVRFRGREMAYTSQGSDKLKAMAEALQDIGKVERMPALDGRQMIMIIAPLKK